MQANALHSTRTNDNLGWFSFPQKTDENFKVSSFGLFPTYTAPMEKSPPFLRLEGKHFLNLWEASLSVNIVMDKGINVLQTWILVFPWRRKWIVLHNHLLWDSRSDKAFDGKVLPNSILWGENIFDLFFKCLEIILYFGLFSLPGVGYMENYFHTFRSSSIANWKVFCHYCLVIEF